MRGAVAPAATTPSSGKILSPVPETSKPFTTETSKPSSSTRLLNRALSVSITRLFRIGAALRAAISPITTSTATATSSETATHPHTPRFRLEVSASSFTSLYVSSIKVFAKNFDAEIHRQGKPLIPLNFTANSPHKDSHRHSQNKQRSPTRQVKKVSSLPYATFRGRQRHRHKNPRETLPHSPAHRQASTSLQDSYSNPPSGTPIPAYAHSNQSRPASHPAQPHTTSNPQSKAKQRSASDT